MYKINKKQIQTIYNCPACNHKNFLKISDIFYNNKFSFFTTSYCKTCTLIFRSKRPKESWFIKNWNLRHNIQKKSSIDFINPQIEKDRKKRYQLILEKIITKNQKILDIGCGPGTGLKAFTKKNTIHGIEPDITRAKIAKKNKIKIFTCSLKKFFKKNKSKKYDLIIMLHTLEHMFDPRETIKIIRLLLKKDGKLIIEVPNFDDWVKSWHDSLYLAHNQNFNLLSLNKLLIEENLFPTKIFYTKYNNQEKNICSIYKKNITNKKNKKKLFNLISKNLHYKKIKRIYGGNKSKYMNINVNKINDLSLTYKPSPIIHRDIMNNILEREIKFNKKIKKYEIYQKNKEILKKKINNISYKIFLNRKCKKINKFLEKLS